MTRDHLMGYPEVLPALFDQRPHKPYPLGIPTRAQLRLVQGMNSGDVSPTLADYLPNDVVQCTAGDLRAIGRNPAIQDARRRGAVVGFDLGLGAARLGVSPAFDGRLVVDCEFKPQGNYGTRD